MSQLYEIAGTVMGFFDAFKGSRPAINNDKILIVRGRSRTPIPIDKFEEKLEELKDELGATEITNKDKISKIVEIGDKHIQNIETTTNAVDNSGFMKMKQELESMGLVVEYKIFEVPAHNVIVAIWEDKNEIPPLYVEVTVSRAEGE